MLSLGKQSARRVVDSTQDVLFTRHFCPFQAGTRHIVDQLQVSTRRVVYASRFLNGSLLLNVCSQEKLYKELDTMASTLSFPLYSIQQTTMVSSTGMCRSFILSVYYLLNIL